MEEDFNDHKNIDLQRMADKITNYAYKLSLDKEYKSPFYKLSGNYHKYLGGKSDDITVIVAQINEGFDEN